MKRTLNEDSSKIVHNASAKGVASKNKKDDRNYKFVHVLAQKDDSGPAFFILL